MPQHPRLPRTLLSSAGVVAVSVAAVVAVLVLPGWLARGGATGPDRPTPPTPTRAAEVVGTRTWTALDCPGGSAGCRVPLTVNLAGARFGHGRSHQQVVDPRRPSTRALVRTISPAGGRRWLLVGADGAGANSQLSIRLGGAPSESIPPGTLTMLSVPGTHRPVQVTVADDGRAGSNEVLRIEEYLALP